MKCYLCGTGRDLRPCGKDGQPICFNCMKADPEREKEARGQFGAMLGEGTSVQTDNGPVKVWTPKELRAALRDLEKAHPRYILRRR